MMADQEQQQLRSLGVNGLRSVLKTFTRKTNIVLDTVLSFVGFFTGSIGGNTSLTSAAKEERTNQEHISHLAETALVDLKKLEAHYAPGLKELHSLVESHMGPVRFVGIASTERNISGLDESADSPDYHGAQHGSGST